MTRAEIQLDPNAVIAAVRECARITSPDTTDSEFEEIRAANDPIFARTVDEISRTIRAYLSALPFLPVQVAVKKMAWIRPPLSDTLSRCDTDFGTYRTWTHDEANGKWFWSVEGGWNEANGEAPNEEAAKAAAQADYSARILSALEPSALDMGNPITLTYTNYRGETSERAITPIRPWFGSTEWHPDPQWLLRAYDHDKGAERDFALKDFGRQQPSAARSLALEEAAQFIESHIYTSSPDGVRLVPSKRAGLDLHHQTIAAAIRALSSPGHADDLAVDRFAIAMKQKLAKKREEGRGGWENKDDCSAEYLSYLLIQHIWKGDPVDIANLAMMLHQRGERVVIDSETSFIIPDHADAGKVEGDGGRWRIFEAACARGYWGIELEQASNDDEPILYPIKVHRDTLVRIVEAHNAGLPSAPSGGDRHGE
ncbi:hypothetical protein [Ochrobactrum sp. A-1]|uniref:hypothetical protein n=1 Tax=Ochrobactrum sp. A-1 TaxID=2920940 RepID=UPI001F0B5126|nr:hypothetical protein [Ochrobactrum sp. A-1]